MSLRLRRAVQKSIYKSFTAGPTWLQKIPGYEHDPHAHFWSVASLLYSPERENNLKEPQPSKVHSAVLPPDEHLACFDYLYYVCAHTVRDFSSILSYFIPIATVF